MRTIGVELGERSYPIYLGNGNLAGLPAVWSSHRMPSSLAVITDRQVASLHLRELSNAFAHNGIRLSSIVLRGGEKQKSLSQADSIIAKLLGAGHPRSFPIIAFGGGVIGDLAGFVAATYRRGTPFVQIPTTLLAQAESSIGGKVGVNHQLTKNAIATFYQPQFVFSDVRLLSTLPPREVVCGMGEILKYAILDEQIFSFVDSHLDSIIRLDLELVEETVARCNAFKAKLISEDERERSAGGGRTVLNLGHRIGHALEQLSGYELHHGEAVLIGLRWELAIAKEAKVIDQHDFVRISGLLRRIRFQPRLKFLRPGALIGQLFSRNGKPRFVLPESVGKVTVTDAPPPSLVKSVLKHLILD